MMFRNGRSSCFKVIIQCICKRYGGDMEKFETRVLHCSKVDVLLLHAFEAYTRSKEYTTRDIHLWRRRL